MGQLRERISVLSRHHGIVTLRANRDRGRNTCELLGRNPAAPCAGELAHPPVPASTQRGLSASQRRLCFAESRLKCARRGGVWLLPKA